MALSLLEYIPFLAPWQKEELIEELGAKKYYLTQCVHGSNRPSKPKREAMIEYSKKNLVRQDSLSHEAIIQGFHELDELQGKPRKEYR